MTEGKVMTLIYKRYEDTEDFTDLFELFKISYHKSKHYVRCSVRYQKYLHWLYSENPLGPPVGINAYADNILVGHYVCIPTLWMQNGKIYSALLSLNTAVHPNFQRQGIFSKLAEKTYQLARDAEFDFVFGVSNKNSTAGFIKLDFKVITQLYLQISLNFIISKKISPISAQKLTRHLSNEMLNWRLNRPFTSYNEISGKVLSESDNLPFKIISGQTDKKIFSVSRKKFSPSPFCFFIGAQKQEKMITLPSFIRPSSLNLIYKPLSIRSKNLNTELENWNFDFLDFDLA